MSSAVEAGRKRGLLRFTAFRVGFLVGLVTFLSGVWLLHVWMAPYRSDGANVDVAISGEDVTRSGGKMIVIRNQRGSFTQTCNGACDDLKYRASDDENTYVVQVLNKNGACIACDQGRWIMGGYGGWSVRWVVAGEPALKISVSDQIAGTPWRSEGEVPPR